MLVPELERALVYVAWVRDAGGGRVGGDHTFRVAGPVFGALEAPDVFDSDA